MEQKHKTRLFAEYPEDVRDKRLHVLEIPDDYRYMDPELIELFEHSVAPILGLE